LNKPSRDNTARSQPITFEAAKHIISCRIQDAPMQHALRRQCLFKRPHTMTSLISQGVIKFCWPSFDVAVTAAAYHIIDSSVNPVCRKCGAAAHILEHWLQECPTTSTTSLSRVRRCLGFGGKTRAYFLTSECSGCFRCTGSYVAV